jgi:hypothetical protein
VSNATVANTYLVGALPVQNLDKVVMPDIVANLRVDQAWGSAQIMGAIHQVGGGYYGTTLTGATVNGHPSEKYGFAVGGGLKVNFPMIGPGDYFQTQINYTQGALRYAALTPPGAGSPGIFGNGAGAGANVGLGLYQEGVFCGTTAAAAPTTTCQNNSVQLTTTWSVQAAYEHFWTPSLRTSLVGAYTDVSYNNSASAMMCANVQAATAANSFTALSIGGVAVACATGASGAFDFQYYSFSSRTQWNITKDFYVGLEGFYGHLNTMSKGATVTYTAATGAAQPSGVRTLNDQDVFVYRMRVHRDIVP